VVQFHDLAGDVGFQCAVVVRKIGQFVGGHSSPLIRCADQEIKLTLMLRPGIVDVGNRPQLRSCGSKLISLAVFDWAREPPAALSRASAAA
jgi:hypothetical protein